MSNTNVDLELNCWVVGSSYKNVFTVKIADDANISALKVAIKQKKPHAFQHIDADDLDLCQVRARACSSRFD
jgi:hypothetical protein